MSEGNGHDSFAIFALAHHGLTWVRRSGVNDDPQRLLQFMTEADDLRCLPPEDVVVVRGDRDRHLVNHRIPRKVFDGLVQKRELEIIG